MGVRAVFLVGFMASGKSSVGQELARRLDWDFVDLDARIEARERQTIPRDFSGPRRDVGFGLPKPTPSRSDRIARTKHAWLRSAAGRSRSRGTASCWQPGHLFSWMLRGPNFGGGVEDGMRAAFAQRSERICQSLRGTSAVLSAGNGDYRNLG